MRRNNQRKVTSRKTEERRAEEELLEKFHKQLMKLPPAEREKLLRRYNTRFVEGMAMSYLSDVKVLGEEEAKKRLTQLVKDQVDIQFILNKAEQIKKAKN